MQNILNAIVPGSDLLSDMQVIELREDENDSPTASGEAKHWHIFHITARK
jgi:hypothetical protein